MSLQNKIKAILYKRAQMMDGGNFYDGGYLRGTNKNDYEQARQWLDGATDNVLHNQYYANANVSQRNKLVSNRVRNHVLGQQIRPYIPRTENIVVRDRVQDRRNINNEKAQLFRHVYELLMFSPGAVNESATSKRAAVKQYVTGILAGQASRDEIVDTLGVDVNAYNTYKAANSDKAKRSILLQFKKLHGYVAPKKVRMARAAGFY